ncbi:hypothetical protein CH63R_00517 [Colletotrichum higginsianum IMI 349063]|uniref:Uncharacterized protein n=1 Tax=Colletotrichum higginsianum (strain IMI 349063) TaxID=759273 RepID=A0A1B7YTH5_COLHI|nr:hypothetical protein CH63R_00517 [Colletotrichum higginsianum IMI 349063]OBR15337.1 hypothetical protein CH63R_00517 [Colletotrichum higginsianum IMI 349063]GJC92390.1 hypothetical protein ColKHC_01216 [Colletotrichum higginsianum]
MGFSTTFEPDVYPELWTMDDTARDANAEAGAGCKQDVQFQIDEATLMRPQHAAIQRIGC